jgi:hypothetical protein
MKLEKTEKAKEELAPGVRNLGQRERTLLLLLNGQKTTRELASIFKGDVDAIAADLLRQGYLAEVAPSPPKEKPTKNISPSYVSAGSKITDLPPAKAASDQFEGKRSLATTRMFLFDICERMFFRRDPALAEVFRDALRSARDREGMLAASRLMLMEIEIIAGHERADSISERIAMMLPVEMSDTPVAAH